MKKSILFLLGMCVSSAALSGTVVARVEKVRIDSNGHGIVFFDQSITGSPSCIMPTYENAMAFDANTAGGRAIMARALAAKATGDVLKVSGSGMCAIYGNSWTEDLLSFDWE